MSHSDGFLSSTCAQCVRSAVCVCALHKYAHTCAFQLHLPGLYLPAGISNGGVLQAKDRLELAAETGNGNGDRKSVV